MPGVAVTPPRDVEPAPQIDRPRRAPAEVREQRARAVEHPGWMVEETPDGVAPADRPDRSSTLSGEPEGDR
jgi:hypothetical protein